MAWVANRPDRRWPHAPEAPNLAHGRISGSGRQEERNMSLVSVVVVLIVVGVLLWLVNTYIPMDGKIKQILNVVVVIAVVLWLLQAFGVLGNLGNIHVGR
jgi:hypothetical protein